MEIEIPSSWEYNMEQSIREIGQVLLEQFSLKKILAYKIFISQKKNRYWFLGNVGPLVPVRTIFDCVLNYYFVFTLKFSIFPNVFAWQLGLLFFKKLYFVV